MAIMLVKIEDARTLKMNEFFDYGGYCWALSCGRASSRSIAAGLEDFYECTIRTEWVDGIPVLFLVEEQGHYQICGWYKSARIYRQMQTISLFLEGNIKARSIDTVYLRETDWKPWDQCFFKEKLYEVVEEDDNRYEILLRLMDEIPAQVVPVQYDRVEAKIDKTALRRVGNPAREKDRKALYAFCIENCEKLAADLMNDQCESLQEIKVMLAYAETAILYNRQPVDSYYYEAMAREQLGQTKEGLKAIEKALRIEPEAGDLKALKANLLMAYGLSGKGQESCREAIALYEQAFEDSADEAYLLAKGKACTLSGDMAQAYQTYQRITDKALLETAGINTREIERRWPMIAVRGIKNLLRRKS